MERVVGVVRRMLMTSRPDDRRCTRIACIALAAALGIAGCGEDRPTVAGIRSDMGAAVLAAAAAGGSSAARVHYELHSRCGPDDEALDGLTLRASTPRLPASDTPAALDRMAVALADRGLRVERSSEGPQHLRASPDGDSWELEVTSPDSDELAVHAHGVVDDVADVDAPHIITPCG